MVNIAKYRNLHLQESAYKRTLIARQTIVSIQKKSDNNGNVVTKLDKLTQLYRAG